MTSRSLEKVDAAMAEIQTAGIKGELSTLQLDVTDEKSIRRAAASVDEKFGRLDVLINNAATGCMDPDIRTRFQINLETNVLGPMLVSAAFKPLLLKSENPYSIYVSSGAGSLTLRSSPEGAAASLPNGEMYCASKSALNMIMVDEHFQVKDTGLKVFAMCPGFVVSNLRGKDEASRSGWGKAGDPMVSGQTALKIIQGERDADVGKLIHKDGVYAW